MEIQVKLKQIKESPEGTYIIVLAAGKHISEYVMEHRSNTADMKVYDGRILSSEQRKKAYAIEKDVSEYCGYMGKIEQAYVHDELKKECCKVCGMKPFSLSNCNMETAREYINFLLEYALEIGAPLSDTIINCTDDIDAALVLCVKKKICCICGRPGEIHHIDAIGMGNDRRHYDDSGSRVMCLCRKHHTEAHAIGRETFCEKYKVHGISKYRIKNKELREDE